MNLASKMDSQLTGVWVNFFTAAGIPSDVSATYALTFAENRIQNDMLLDLNKEYLRDMGITRMGDVIAILRHAKQVHECAARDRVLSSTVSPKVPVAAVAGRLTSGQTKPASPASRILEHYTRNTTPDASPPSAGTKRRSNDNIDTGNALDVKKTRSIRFSHPPTAASDAAATANKQTVFARLGNSEAGKPVVPTSVPKPVFSRLGSKTAENNDLPIAKDALKYEGILKAAPTTKNTISITASKNNTRKIAVGTMRADQAPLSIREKLNKQTAQATVSPVPVKQSPIQARLSSSSARLSSSTSMNTVLKTETSKVKSVKFAAKVEYKEIESESSASKTNVFNKPGRRLEMAQPKISNNSVKARLGDKSAKSTNNITITKNVFNRLGV